jgi:hypothetical protein
MQPKLFKEDEIELYEMKFALAGLSREETANIKGPFRHSP